MTKESIMAVIEKREAWNKGKPIGQKPPLKPKEIWAIRILPSGTRMRSTI
jgi:hypothetical protein